MVSSSGPCPLYLNNTQPGCATILKKVSKLIDVDEYLSSEKAIKDEMIEAMCSLLESARYDIAAYLEWVAENEGDTNFS